MNFRKASGELVLPEDDVDQVKLSHGSEAVMAKLKRLEQEKTVVIGTTDKFKVNVEYSVHKKKRHMTFKRLEDETFCLNREFLFKKDKVGKGHEETLVRKLLISNKFISKKVLALAE